MLVITKPNKVPHGGYWRYHDNDSGADFAHPSINVLQDQILKHKLANKRSFDLTEFVQNVCKSTGQNICHDADDNSYNTMQQVAAFTSAMSDWVKSGFEMATPDILAMRVEKCNKCEHWRGTRGGALMLGRCKVCGCRGIKLSLATSHCPLGLW